MGLWFKTRPSAGGKKRIGRLKWLEKGFSLVELIVAMSVVGILAGVSIPLYMKQQKKAVINGMRSIVSDITSSILTCAAANSPPPEDLPFDSCGGAMASTKALKQIGAQYIDGIVIQMSNPNVCLQFERLAAGNTYETCVSVNTKTGKAVQKHSAGLCHMETNGGCAAGAASGTCSTTSIECSAKAECPAGPSGTTKMCITASMGVCSAAAECT